ncbi:hypothetical protein DUNSADRAFT_13015 [Dunaliella salina]|uniref:Uncharacterized protein n=1 Tax=Dunaliella salina TaxID=3046 RepID=A0ABQ7GA88_DUNSA|nr:hypothetical protein DUNSADRAFT_13015 [Dunaliella salina]|eukprot:KAF5831510.1 hypothetical protein DUNSADRAFT_13015 [Dunaliella salina]
MMCMYVPQVVFTFTVLEDIRTQDQLETFLTRTSADIEAGINGFTTNQILGLEDFSKLEDCSQSSLEAFTASLAQILDAPPSTLHLDCNYAGSSFVDGTRRSLLSDRILLQAPICPNQKLTIGLQRDYSLQATQASPAGLEGEVSETNGRLAEGLGVEGCMGPAQTFTEVYLSQVRTKASSLEEQCAELRKSLNLPDTEAISEGCEEEALELEEVPSEDEPGGGGSGSSNGRVNKPLAIGLGVGIGGAALLALVALVMFKKKHAAGPMLAQVMASNKKLGPSSPKPPSPSPKRIKPAAEGSTATRLLQHSRQARIDTSGARCLPMRRNMALDMPAEQMTTNPLASGTPQVMIMPAGISSAPTNTRSTRSARAVAEGVVDDVVQGSPRLEAGARPNVMGSDQRPHTQRHRCPTHSNQPPSTQQPATDHTAAQMPHTQQPHLPCSALSSLGHASRRQAPLPMGDNLNTVSRSASGASVSQAPPQLALEALGGTKKHDSEDLEEYVQKLMHR